jgi:hypothetical protein
MRAGSILISCAITSRYVTAFAPEHLAEVAVARIIRLGSCSESNRGRNREKATSALAPHDSAGDGSRLAPRARGVLAPGAGSTRGISNVSGRNDRPHGISALAGQRAGTGTVRTGPTNCLSPPCISGPASPIEPSARVHGRRDSGTAWKVRGDDEPLVDILHIDELLSHPGSIATAHLPVWRVRRKPHVPLSHQGPRMISGTRRPQDTHYNQNARMSRDRNGPDGRLRDRAFAAVRNEATERAQHAAVSTIVSFRMNDHPGDLMDSAAPQNGERVRHRVFWLVECRMTSDGWSRALASSLLS